ncbi:prostaglandin E synthase 3-like [Cynocephalus volans]|uniref:prostaglandin E synthase 3-like n=1 Tax=Cynocephalus volans TaxID=110931 RepID=UPI002FC9CE3A
MEPGNECGSSRFSSPNEALRRRRSWLNSLTATLWETLSQNLPTKPLLFLTHRNCEMPPPKRPAHPSARPPAPFTVQPASAKWYDRRDYVFIEFCVEDSRDVNVNFEKSKLTFSCLGGSDNFKHLNEIDLFHCIDPNDSKHKRTDRSILCCLRKGESGQSWPRLTKERANLNWLSVDFNNWKDWEDDSDEDMSNFDRFSEMMNNMGGDEDVDLPEVDGADDDSQDSDDEKMTDLE